MYKFFREVREKYHTQKELYKGKVCFCAINVLKYKYVHKYSKSIVNCFKQIYTNKSNLFINITVRILWHLNISNLPLVVCCSL